MFVELKQIHHVAYRCKDAKETVDFYQRVLNMGFVLAIAENEVPSTKEPDPYMHVFLDAGMGNVLAFFELPNSQTWDEMSKRPSGFSTLHLRSKTWLPSWPPKHTSKPKAWKCLVPVNHGIFKSSISLTQMAIALSWPPMLAPPNR